MLVRARKNQPRATKAEGRFVPRLCENSFRSPRRIAKSEIRYAKSPEIACTWLKSTPENGAHAFSHSLCPKPPFDGSRARTFQIRESRHSRRGPGRFRLQTVYRRLILIGLLLATVLQGPVLTYAAATLGSNGIHNSATQACGGLTVLDEKNCERCCGHGSMPSCLMQCVAVPGAVIPLMSKTSFWIGARGSLIPDAGAAPFPERDPPHPFRPPIV
jgi:hypothetical protein